MTTNAHSAAAQRALGIVELLEQVLFHLDFSDILVNAQRVSRFWKNCTDGSVQLQDRCWLRHIPMSEQNPDPHFMEVLIPDRLADALTLDMELPSSTLYECSVRSTDTFSGYRDELVRGVITHAELKWLSCELFWLKAQEKRWFGPGPADLDLLWQSQLLQYCGQSFSCSLCGNSHETMIKEHLHPKIRSLAKNRNCCFLGFGNQIMLRIAINPQDRFFNAADGMMEAELRASFGQILASMASLFAAASNSTSWKESTLMQPACKTVDITVAGSIRHGNLRTTIMAEHKHEAQGVTVGRFIGAIKTMGQNMLADVQVQRTWESKDVAQMRYKRWTQWLDAIP